MGAQPWQDRGYQKVANVDFPGVMLLPHVAVLKEIAALAERYDVPLRSTTRADMAPDEAILREAGRGYDLVVLGVSRRPGDVLFFGNTAAAVLERSPTSNLFVAS